MAASASASSSKGTTKVGGLTFVKNESYTVTSKERHHKESGSPFDATRVGRGAHVVEHEVYGDRPVDESAFSQHIVTVRRMPAARLKAGSGLGGTIKRGVAGGPRRAPAPARGKTLRATSRRPNPPNTMFRRLFERGDLPICVKHSSAGIRVGWTQAIEKLDLHHHLPIFMSGLRETEEPFMSLSLYGTLDLLATAGDRVLPVVPQMIQPLREALTTRDQAIVRRVMEVLQKLVKSGELVGEALVPFFRQLLPVLNVFKTKHHDIGDKIDYGQRFRRNIGELVQETLETLEVHGGPDAFINLRYCVPTYESVVFTV